MNQLAAELRTPPLPVISFINCPELHKDIGTYFNSNLRPPLFFVSLPEANEAVLVRLFGEHAHTLAAVAGRQDQLTAELFDSVQLKHSCRDTSSSKSIQYPRWHSQSEFRSACIGCVTAWH